jgi:hypothetical protein
MNQALSEDQFAALIHWLARIRTSALKSSSLLKRSGGMIENYISEGASKAVYSVTMSITGRKNLYEVFVWLNFNLRVREVVPF